MRATRVLPSFVATALLAGLAGAAAPSGCAQTPPHRTQVGRSDCATCHEAEYLAAGGPDAGVRDGGVACSLSHTSPLAFPTNCAVCHVTSDWCDAPIERLLDNHANDLELSGGHTTTSVTDPTPLAQCVTCHLPPPEAPTEPDWLTRPGDCASCHADDLAVANTKRCTTHPSFPSDCAQCHRSDAWSPAVPGLHPTNRFPIRAGSRHQHIACQTCHDIDRLPAGASALPECVGGIVVDPPAPTPSAFPGCDENDTCPECNCATCHDPTRNAGRHDEVRTEYAACVAADRASLCWNCHYPGSRYFR